MPPLVTSTALPSPPSPPLPPQVKATARPSEPAAAIAPPPVFGRPEFDTADIEIHKMDVVLKLGLDAGFAPLAEQRDDLAEVLWRRQRCFGFREHGVQCDVRLRWHLLRHGARRAARRGHDGRRRGGLWRARFRCIGRPAFRDLTRELGRRWQVGRVGEPYQNHVRRLVRRGGAHCLFQPLEQDLPGARQDGHVEGPGHFPAAGALHLGCIGRIGDRRRDLDAGHPVGDLEQILQHGDRIRAVPPQALHQVEGGGYFAFHQRVEQVEDRRTVGEAEHFLHLRRCHLGVAKRDRLVEQRQPIAHRPVRGAGDDADRFIFRRDGFPLGDISEMRDKLLHVEPAQVEALAARKNRYRHLANFGGGEHETDMFGRLLERLQQRVEGVSGQHVHFVDDVHLVARHHRAVAHAVDQFADVVDAGAACRVHLDDVDMPIRGDGLALVADPAGLWRDAARAVRPDAIERARDNPRGRGFSDPAHARQHIGMGETAALDRIGEGPDERVLANQLGKSAGSVFAGEYAVRGGAVRSHMAGPSWFSGFRYRRKSGGRPNA